MDAEIKIVEIVLVPNANVTNEAKFLKRNKSAESCMLCGVIFGSAGAWSKKNPTNFGFSKELDLISQQLLFNIYDMKCLDYACEDCAELLSIQDNPFVYFVNDLYKR